MLTKNLSGKEVWVSAEEEEEKGSEGVLTTDVFKRLLTVTVYRMAARQVSLLAATTVRVRDSGVTRMCISVHRRAAPVIYFYRNGLGPYLAVHFSPHLNTLTNHRGLSSPQDNGSNLTLDRATVMVRVTLATHKGAEE